MTDSIREQILTAFGIRLTDILKENQYNSDMGTDVLRSHMPAIDGEICPAIGYHVAVEESEERYRRIGTNVFSVNCQGIAISKSTKPPQLAEKLFADILECVLSDQYTLGFDSGGITRISAGDTIVDENTAAEGLVISITKDSGTWAGGDAAGSFLLRRVKGTFEDDNELKVGNDTGLATVDGAPTAQSAISLSTAGLAEGITYSQATVIMPEAPGNIAGVQVTFEIRYHLISGNPYSQD